MDKLSPKNFKYLNNIKILNIFLKLKRMILNRSLILYKSVIFVFLFFLIFIVGMFFVNAISPTGASVDQGTSETAPIDGAGSVPAIAGNVTRVNIYGYSTTSSWQGYYGNVSGTLQLADSNDNVLYNWTLASPQGEVYASTNASIQWDNVACFNYTASGTLASDTAQAGATSLYGINLSTLETRFNISHDDVDGVNETFSLWGAATHDKFYTANREFDVGECRNTRIYDQTGQGVSDKFEEVLLYEPVSTSVIFTALLEQDQTGFNTGTNDFEMLVLENGHGSDVDSTNYYFFVELE